jgi:hypothetical protein
MQGDPTGPGISEGIAMVCLTGFPDSRLHLLRVANAWLAAAVALLLTTSCDLALETPEVSAKSEARDNRSAGISPDSGVQ